MSCAHGPPATSRRTLATSQLCPSECCVDRPAATSRRALIRSRPCPVQTDQQQRLSEPQPNRGHVRYRRTNSNVSASRNQIEAMSSTDGPTATSQRAATKSRPCPVQTDQQQRLSEPQPNRGHVPYRRTSSNVDEVSSLLQQSSHRTKT